MSESLNGSPCFGCQATRICLGVGAGGYLILEAQRAKTRSHKVALVALSTVFFGLGISGVFENKK